MTEDLYNFEIAISDAFTNLTNKVEDTIKQILKDKLRLEVEWIDVENQQLVNVTMNQVNGEQSRDLIILKSKPQANGCVELTLSSPTDLFQGKIKTVLTDKQSQTFRSMMLISEAYDCYIALRGNPPKELNSDYKTWGDVIKAG